MELFLDQYPVAPSKGFPCPNDPFTSKQFSEAFVSCHLWLDNFHWTEGSSASDGVTVTAVWSPDLFLLLSVLLRHLAERRSEASEVENVT